jgi:hypothetical protein
MVSVLARVDDSVCHIANCIYFFSDRYAGKLSIGTHWNHLLTYPYFDESAGGKTILGRYSRRSSKNGIRESRKECEGNALTR